ncbi:hypothetical protein L915_12018 [Phytophthora nicotianae]|uniref:Uncharacterized protein n=1 Tax=Phytophthora nicotianae TaxID=4792 RepID=W2GI85_PHYNI|nr:hypothetical protein L915_12018 [Phytophthora nicotianae]ETL36028.1 hypothetical protein L916_11942 [Phytophthora nicotianae]
MACRMFAPCMQLESDMIVCMTRDSPRRIHALAHYKRVAFNTTHRKCCGTRQSREPIVQPADYQNRILCVVVITLNFRELSQLPESPAKHKNTRTSKPRSLASTNFHLHRSLASMAHSSTVP